MLYANYAEYLKLPEFRLVCDAVRARSMGRCEWCGLAKATEVHHVAYCKWGQVDTEINLLDVCNPCHCELHTCKQCGDIKLKARHIKAGSQVCDDCKEA